MLDSERMERLGRGRVHGGVEGWESGNLGRAMENGGEKRTWLVEGVPAEGDCVRGARHGNSHAGEKGGGKFDHYCGSVSFRRVRRGEEIWGLGYRGIVV